MQMLVVDDDPMYQKLLAGFAKRLGHEPLVAADGEAAWKIYLDRRPRIVLSDWMMPKLSGVDLCRRIRALATRERPYILLVTSLSASEDMLAGFRAGADDYVAKPFDHEVFATRVAAATERIKDALGQEERLHREVVAKCQGALGHDHPELMESLGALSRIYAEQQVFAKARAFVRRQIELATHNGDAATVESLRASLEDIQRQERAAQASATTEDRVS